MKFEGEKVDGERMASSEYACKGEGTVVVERFWW